MRCPYCRTPCHEGTAECQHCGFSFVKVSQMFGTPPQLQEHVSDLATLFDRDQQKRLREILTNFSSRFPQIQIDILTTALEPGVDLRTYCFWVFNASPLAREGADSASNLNHNILFTIDAANGRANMLIGYGLEPFVGEQHLDRILATGSNHFRERDYFEGSVACLEALGETLTRIHANIGRTYGIEMPESRPGRAPTP